MTALSLALLPLALVSPGFAALGRPVSFRVPTLKNVPAAYKGYVRAQMELFFAGGHAIEPQPPYIIPHKKIHWTLPDDMPGYYPSNTDIREVSPGEFMAAVRYISYRLECPDNCTMVSTYANGTMYSEIHDSRLVLLEGLKIEPAGTFRQGGFSYKFRAPYRAHRLVDQEREITRFTLMKGIADVRTFELGGDLWYIGSNSDAVPPRREKDDRHVVQPVLGRFSAARDALLPFVPLRYRNHHIEKNWLPYVERDAAGTERLMALYSVYPLVTLEVNQTSGECREVRADYPRLGVRDGRNSAGPIRVGRGWLILAHEMFYSNRHGYNRNYVNRFMLYDSKWRLEAVSMHFRFFPRRFKMAHYEFALGMWGEYRTPGGADLVSVLLAPTYMDRNPVLMRIEYKDILSLMLRIPPGLGGGPG